jgi:hypothetical protein
MIDFFFSNLGLNTIEPMSIFFLILVQIGGRYLKIDLTNAQQKIINEPLFQAILLFSVIFMATKNFIISITIVAIVYLFVYILFNENHKYNLFSKKWLINEKLIDNINDISMKNLYLSNISKVI